jgi:hypothetical protein
MTIQNRRIRIFMIHPVKSSFIQPVSENLIDQIIDNKIEEYKHWKDVSKNISKIAITLIKIQGLVTILILASPILPATAVVSLMIICAAVVVAGLAATSTPAHDSQACIDAFVALFGNVLNPSIEAGRSIASTIYTVQVAVIITVANSVFFLSAVALYTGCNYVCCKLKRDILAYRELRSNHKMFLEQEERELSDPIKKKLLDIYMKAYLERYKKDLLFILPTAAEKEIERLIAAV